MAYLLGVPDWARRVQEAAEAEPPTPAAADRSADREAAKQKAARSGIREDAGRLRAEVADLRREVEELRRRLRRAEGAARASAGAYELAQERVTAAQQERTVVERELSAEVRRLRSKLRDAEASAVAARRGSRSERDSQTARLRVLLETVTGAAAGLRRELDLPVGTTHPADGVAQETAGGEQVVRTQGLLAALRRGRPSDDPALIDAILTVPGVHLIVDGYNVTKLGYPTLTLEDQRGRLVNGLGGHHLPVLRRGGHVRLRRDRGDSSARCAGQSAWLAGAVQRSG